MSEFFENKVESNLIPPDYSSSLEEDDDIIEDLDETIEAPEEDIIEATEPLLEKAETDNKKEINNNMSATSPFGTPTVQPSSPWSNNNGSSGWGSSGSSSFGGGFGGFGSQQNKPAFGGFGTTSTPWGQQNTGQKETINRNKKVIFIPFLDGLVETYDSHGRAGLPPRGIFDLTPRFAVWEKIAAFNPARVYSIVPINIINNSNGNVEGWDATFGYFCCSLSAFLRMPENRCQILAQPTNGQPSEAVIKTVLRSTKITPEEVVYLGNYSGFNGMSDIDKRTAENCNIDYIDITQLVNNMF